jgi:SAM-dependent methyltransferase/predicted O-methyltransferase YrrM
MGGSPWSGHRRFVYDLLGWWRPRRIVDLGVHWGCSTFAFAQAVQDHGLECEVVGVDTFCGDAHSGLYGEEVYSFVRNCAAEAYGRVRIRLERCTFDEGLTTVSDESADLIHLDGCHTYESLRHDFEQWLPKLARDGMMLMHDIKPHQPYGSEKFWAEIVEAFPSIEFHHSWGLGILFPRGDGLYRDLLSSQFLRWLPWYPRENQSRHQALFAGLQGPEREGGSSASARGAEPPSPDTSDVDWWRYRCRARVSGRLLRRVCQGKPSRIMVMGAESPTQLVELHLALPDAELHAVGTMRCGAAMRASLPRACVQHRGPMHQLQSETFDGAISFAALERDPHPELAIEEVARCLRPGGVLLATSPSVLWCYLEARRLDGTAWGCPPVLMRKGFERACSERGLSVPEHGRFMLAPLSVLAESGKLDRAERLRAIEPWLDRIPLLRLALANRYFVATRLPNQSGAGEREHRADDRDEHGLHAEREDSRADQDHTE